MCIAKLLGFGGSKSPQQQPPAALPPPNANASALQEDPVTDESADLKRKGRSALRIDMTGPKVTGGSGLNIPQG